MTLIPLALYFTPRGWAKVELGLAKGKKLHDKRAADQGARLAAREAAAAAAEIAGVRRRRRAYRDVNRLSR